MWGLGRRSQRALEVTPKHEEYFRDADDHAEAVVREATQNSLDAKSPNSSVVKVRFALTEIPGDLFAKRYLGDLPRHYEQWRPGFTSSLFNGAPIPALLIEDFGAAGLKGAWNRADNSSAFHAFWRQYGASPKGKNTGGRHGVGKSTLAAASKVRMFFGLTIREDDKQQLLMGQATLGPHELDGHLFDSYAQFSPTKGDELPLPFEGTETESFKTDFALGRGVEPGLSIVIPLPHEELAEVGLPRVRRAIIANCFPQVAAGVLECDVAGAPLNRVTLKSWAAEFPELKLEAAIDMAVEVFAPDAPKPFAAGAVDRNAELADDRFSEGDLAAMRAAFAEGRTISARIPVNIRKRGAATETGYVSAHLRRTREDQHAAEIYVRGRVTVPKQRKVLVSRNAVGLLVAEDGPLSEFLGDAEPPSHARWTAVNVREKAKYVTPDDTLRITAGTLRQLERLVQDENLERIFEDAFKDLFWRPKPPEQRPKPETDTDEKPELPPARVFWEVRERPGGFEVARTESGAPPSVAVEVAYARRRGKPDWKPTDFQLHGGAITLKQNGSGTVEPDGHVIQIRNADLGFSLAATGFDPNRDLIVKVLAVEEVLDAAAA